MDFLTLKILLNHLILIFEVHIYRSMDLHKRFESHCTKSSAIVLARTLVELHHPSPNAFNYIFVEMPIFFKKPSKSPQNCHLNRSDQWDHLVVFNKVIYTVSINRYKEEKKLIIKNKPCFDRLHHAYYLETFLKLSEDLLAE